VDAAHLIPFEVSRDDKPSNGLALYPNHHRAMDRHLIAPCPDPEHQAKAGMWRVSSRVDERKDSRRDLVGLDGRPVLEPSEARFLPSIDSLRWREKRLLAVQI
jgi:putative restriction endonuclease